MFSKLLAIALGASFVTGCAIAPRVVPPEGAKGLSSLEAQARDTFKDLPSIVTIKLQKGALSVQEPEVTVPPGKDRVIKADFTDKEVEDILYSVAAMYGINIVYQPVQLPQTQLSSQQSLTTVSGGGANGQGGGSYQDLSKLSSTGGVLRHKPVSIFFNGKLSDFLKALSRTSGYFFSFENGTVVVREYDSFNLPIPSYGEVYKEIEASLKSLGAVNTSYDRFTSTISFVADSNTLQRVKGFCKTLKDNASFVQVRIMLLNVQFSEEKNAGIDWSKLQFGYKGQSIYSFGNQASQASSGSSSSATTGGIAPSPGFGAMGTATGAQLFVEGANFSLGAVLNFLESYGSYKLMQDVFAGSMSGAKGHLDSLDTKSYISEISFQALNQVTTPSQAVKQSAVDSGVEMDFTPNFSEASGTLTMPLKIVVSNATLNQATVGSLLGSMTLPDIARKKIETTLIMAPTQVAVIGGLVQEVQNSNTSGIPGDTVLSKTQSVSKQKEVLVAIVKPTVYKFE